MFLELSLTALLIITVYYLGTNWLSNAWKTKSLNLPPGPRPYPIIGNLPSLLGSARHLDMDKLAKEYGEIYSLTLPGGQRCVVINTADLAREALLTRKDELSGRPYMFVASYINRNASLISIDFNPTLLRLRKIIHSALRIYGERRQHLEDKITYETDDLARRFLAYNGNPVDPKYDVAVAVLNIICSVVYGKRYDVNDQEFKSIVEFQEILSAAFGSLSMLELIPWLRFIPYKSIRRLHYARDSRDEIINREYQAHKEKFEIESAGADFHVNDLTDALLKALSEDVECEELLSEDHVMMTMNDVFAAGYDTTTFSILWLLALMVNYPQVQARIHKELDEKIGSAGLPELKDRHAMPYLEATIAEAQRFKTLLPLCIPHKSTCDTELAGYDIPQGTTFIINLWSIHHNPDDWENPHEFKPERFLTEEGKFTGAGERSYLPFSAGRRGCPGQSLAKTDLFLIFSRVLHQFKLTKSPEDPLPSLAGHTGISYHPISFKMVFKERTFKDKEFSLRE